MTSTVGVAQQNVEQSEKTRQVRIIPFEENATPIVDTHQHLWDLSKFRLPWLDGAGEPLAKSHLMSDYLRETDGLNVVKTVYMEVDVEPSQLVAEAEYVIDLCERSDNPMAGAVIGGRPASADFKDYVQRFKGSPYIKGVRQVLHGGPRGVCLSDEFVRGVRLLGEAGMRFDICIRSEELPDAVKLVDLCPETRFVLDHCGNANVQAQDRSQWRRDMTEVAQRSNVICKISGIIASAKPGEWTPNDLAPIVRHCIDVFGKDRVIFASDWPVCTVTATYRQWVEALKTIVQDWTEADRRKLFQDNAVRFYELS
jgi:predicted TIM-barrel fold metal-dependent hydrolase